LFTAADGSGVASAMEDANDDEFVLIVQGVDGIIAGKTST
jgi:hypothetical protein